MDEPIAIVLAAGKGTRMKSDLPKVLVEICGRPMIEYVLDALAAAGIGRVLLVVGYRSEMVRERLGTAGTNPAGHRQSAAAHRENPAAGRLPNITFVEQTEQLGTGHAVMVCREHLARHNGPVLVVTGDSPLIQPSSVRKLLARFADQRPACILGTAHKDDPGGLGRIVRDSAGNFVKIVEVKDASEADRRITECNMSTYVFDGPALMTALAELRNNNAQREYYITDCCGILRDRGHKVLAVAELEPCEALSINNLDELAEVEAVIRSMSECRQPLPTRQ
jgi:bifunctional UDP-N-acetylglucosamine pyrophosphorylase/glucosamine-1-phosphate N-acetyltransferase/UDP-N-acetylglucosamine pyrophosphorylase